MAGPADAVLEKVARTIGWQRATEAARRLMEWQGSVRGVDGPLSTLYRAGLVALRGVLSRAHGSDLPAGGAGLDGGHHADVLAAGLAWVLAAVSVLGELRGAT